MATIETTSEPSKALSGVEKLVGAELHWAKYQPWLESIGYSLRARYQPGWKASWLTSKRDKVDSEDSLVLNVESSFSLIIVFLNGNVVPSLGD